MKVSNDFYIQEFVPESIYKQFGDSSIWFVDPKIIDLAQYFRDRYAKPVTINDWFLKDGGNFNFSGFRPPGCAVGAPLSQHRFGRAGDLKFLSDNVDIDEVRQDIRDNWDVFRFRGLTTIELGTDTWLHCDTRPTNLESLFEVSYY